MDVLYCCDRDSRDTLCRTVDRTRLLLQLHPSSTGLARVAQPVWWITASIKADCRNYCLPFQLFPPLLSLHSPLPHLPCRPAELRLSRCLLLKHFNVVLTLPSSVYSMVISRLRAGWPESHGSPPGRGKKFFFSPHRPSRLCSHPPFTQWVPRIRRPEREADHSPPYMLKLKMIGTIISTPPHGFMAWSGTTSLLLCMNSSLFGAFWRWYMFWCWGGAGGFMIYLEQWCLLFYLLTCLELEFENFCTKHDEL